MKRLDPLEQISELVHQQRGSLVAVARQEGLGPEDSLECVQDALCTFVSLEDSTSLEHDQALARLKTIVKNAARNARRRHHRVKVHIPVTDEPLPASERDPETALSHAESIVRLRACVAELCSIQRAVVMLRLLEERSGQDVAEEVGLSRAHVDVLLSRARASLRVCMRPLPGDA